MDRSVILLDNYDSFVYNLARYVNELGRKQKIFRNDQITISRIKSLAPSHIIISPGPCTPNQTGNVLEIIDYFAPLIPILGVCLGHQAIAQVYGAEIVRAKSPVHGKSDWITHSQKGLYHSLPSPLQVARYHSLIVAKDSFPEDTLEITACNSEGEIMGLRHKIFPAYGVQFHPESVLTQQGKVLLKNFLDQ